MSTSIATKKVHRIFALPEQGEEFDQVLSDLTHGNIDLAFSTTTVEGQPKHFALLVWHNKEYGDDNF